MKKLLLATAVLLQCAAAFSQNFDNTFWTNGFCSFEATQNGDQIEFLGSASLGDTGYDFTLIKTGRNTFVTQNGGSYIFGRTVEFRTIDNGDDKVADGELIVLDGLKLDAIKTKEMVKVVDALETGKKVTFVLPEKDDIIYRSARNIAGVKTTLVNTLNVYDILNCDTLVVLKDAVSKIEEVYA